MLFQHTAARRRLVAPYGVAVLFLPVSTHSRPKAAGGRNAQHYKGNRFQHTAARRRLAASRTIFGWFTKFQHTAARRRLEWGNTASDAQHIVSTHSRPKAAGETQAFQQSFALVSTHSRPKAAGRDLWKPIVPVPVSTHSRPKAAGYA